MFRVTPTAARLARASHQFNAATSRFASTAAFAKQLKDSSLWKNQNYINGSWCAAESKKTIDVKNPTTGVLLDQIPHATGIETKRAIEAAEAALPKWRALLPKQRADLMMKWYELMMQHKDDLAAILTTEQGKPLAEATGEIVYSASFLQLYAEEATRVYGEVLPSYSQTARIVVMKQPVGVVAAITPWNFPSAMITRKCGAALAVGCTVVLKPSELTPYSAFALVELAERAGIPPGVINIVTGDATSIGEEMCRHPVVKKVTFTGSTRVGKLLMKQCADTVKRVSMELGGNAPFIVFDDADVDAAVAGALVCKFRNTGQTCVTANRIFVQSGVYDQFAEKLAEKVRAIKVGSGFDSVNTCGPLINGSAIEKVDKQVKDALSKGGKLLAGGNVMKTTAGPTAGGLFYTPTVIRDANTNMEVFKEETFGPAAFLFKFSSEEEAIRLANDTSAGLASYFYTKDYARIWRVSEALQYGMVAVNQPLVSSAVAPFGGMKESGVGREGSHYGLHDYLDIKCVHMGGIQQA